MLNNTPRSSETLAGGKVLVKYHDVPASSQAGNCVMICTINRPERRNAVDRETAQALYSTFTRFARDPALSVAILTGSGGHFCAGADLKAIFDNFSRLEGNSIGQTSNTLDSDIDAPGPMGVSRLVMNKPVIAAISGYAVAGGLELAAWCDIRVACEDSAKLGVLCRLRGVPLIDGGTIRLPALIGASRAADLILTGKLVDAREAYQMGLVNYTVRGGHEKVLQKALDIAINLTKHPRSCMLNDRRSMLSSVYGMSQDDDLAHGAQEQGEAIDFKLKGNLRKAMQKEFELGMKSLAQLQMEGAVGEFVNKTASKL